MSDLVTEARDWAKTNWDPDMTLRAWWAALFDAGLSFPTWPVGLGGRGASGSTAKAVGSALAAVGVLGAPSGIGPNLAGPTILAHGTPEQQQRFVPAIARGEAAWCQLFSEPGAGSDLAGLRTRAVADGDEYVVDGQKVWNSGASKADFGLLLARTDPLAPKHRGISYFAIDMHQPGVDARPLHQMNGHAEFDEVFFTGARVGADQLIGTLGDGWTVTHTTLAFERASIGGGGMVGSFQGGEGHGYLDQKVGELLDRLRNATRSPYSGYMLGNRTLIDLAREFGRTDDPVIRQRLVAYRMQTEVNRLNGMRGRAAAARGSKPGAEGSIGKLAISDIAKASRDLSLQILGPYGMLAGADGPHEGAVLDVALSSFAASIGGGTDNIQRNVISERFLGLPREPDDDRDKPFNETRMA